MVDAWQSDLDHLSWIADDALDFTDRSILDLGCGSGFLCESLKKNGARKSLGLDLIPPKSSSDAWIFLERNLDTSNWHDGIDESFDYIFAFDILEHVESPFLLLKSCYGLLNKGGKIIITTPNTSSWESCVRPKNWSGVQDPQHKVLFSKYSLSFILSRVGFNVEKLSAPIRKLKFLGPLSPQVGGQIYCVATKATDQS